MTTPKHTTTNHHTTTMKNALIAISGSFLAVGIGLCASVIYDSSTNQRYSAATTTGLALASMVIPAVGVLPLMAARELD